jgi:hypothetical protein
MLSNRFYRSLVLNSFLFISVLLFHHLGGGSFSVSPAIIPLFVISSLYFNARPLKEFSGPGLAATLVVFQILGHLVFHDDTAASDGRMYVSHSLAVVITYVVARYFEKISYIFEALVESVRPIISFEWFIPKIQYILLCIKSDSKIFGALALEVLKGRAPPASSRA